jgi:hypothetical protein
MTDIAIPDQPTPGVDLEVWANQARSAAVYAEAVCSTQMAPVAYRNKPAEATAAILAGAELGFSPMASLRAFDSIQGVPAPKAITLRAVLLAQGHEIETVEQTSTRAVVRGRRKGKTEWQTSVWDVERASLMEQFKKNPMYKTNPAAMFLARATAEVCRWVASDAIMGMPYAAEELATEPGVLHQIEKPAVRRLTAADLDAPPAIEAVNTDDGGEPILDEQRRHMFALWGEMGFSGDENREQRLAITAKILGIRGELESSSDLTRSEAGRVIAALIERKEQTAAAGPDGGDR